MEQWKMINGCTHHAVSNYGKVKNTITGYIFNGCIDNTGYIKIVLSENGKHKKFHAHRLVLEAFVGKCPDGYECSHKDNVKTNNKLENLEWMVKTEHARMHSVKRFHEGEIFLMRELVDSGIVSMRFIAKMFKTDHRYIGRVHQRIYWSHI